MNTYVDETKTDAKALPVVRNLREASNCNHLFDAVITAGPDKNEVRWGHPNHFIRTFDDVTYKARWYVPPTIEQVEDMLVFASDAPDNLLIHCHAGISRSTATAIGAALARGWSAEDALTALTFDHPNKRSFRPNSLMIAHIEEIFDISGLSEYVESFRNHGWDD